MQYAVAAINGFLGDRRGIDVADIVNPRALTARMPYYTSCWGGPARGGSGPIAKKRFYKWCRIHVDGGFKIIMVGKSYGGHWCLDAIEDLGIGGDTNAIVFDPSCTLRRAESQIRAMPDAGDITVVRQLGHRSGYRVYGAKDIILDAKHSTIERTKDGRRILDEWLTERNL